MQSKGFKYFSVFVGIVFFVASLIAGILLLTDKYEERYRDDEYLTANDWQGWMLLGVGTVTLLLTQQVSGTCEVGDEIASINGKNEQIVRKLENIERRLTANAPEKTKPAAVYTPAGQADEKVPAWKRVAEVADQKNAKEPQAAPAVSSNNTGFCKQCGAARKEGAVFCQSCGNKFN